MKKFTLAFAIFFLAVGFASPISGAEIPDEQFVVSSPPSNVPSLGVVIEDSQHLKNTFSSLQAFTADGTQEGVSKVTTVTDCLSYNSTGCEPNKFFLYLANLAFCDANLTSDCVDSVFATDSNSKALEVNYVAPFPEKMPFAFKGDASVNLPAGGSTFLVDIPAAKHAGGTLYLIVAQMIGAKSFTDTQFRSNGLNLGIFAVSKVSGNYEIAGPSKNITEFRTLGQVANTRIPYDKTNNHQATCAQSSTTECLVAWPMPLDIKFGITLKAHSKVTGWLHGRTSDTSAEINLASNGDQLIKVSGNASLVPSIYAWFPKSELPASVLNYYQSNPKDLLSGTSFGQWSSDLNSSGSLLKDSLNYTENSFPEALAWYSALKDKAPMAATQWSVRSANSGQDPKGCFNNNPLLSGIVSTNSNFFIAGPPVFNQSENSLDYKVASPHYLPNGEVFRGSYNLLIKSDVARCIYGFTAAPVSASVSIVSADGTTEVATTSLGEKNGWLYLSAGGFTFSSPTVRVKLTQESENSTPSAAPKSTTDSNVMKKVSITCVKGKISKKVTSINPKCPTGYKKK
jgi:hypothetical protein